MAISRTRGSFQRAILLSCVVAVLPFDLPAASGARRSRPPQDKEAMTARMLELAQRIDVLNARLTAHPENSDLEMRIAELTLEYDSISAALGGDRAHANRGTAPSTGTAVRGGTSPPPPPGCGTQSLSVTNSTPIEIPATSTPVLTSTVTVTGAVGTIYDVNLTTFIVHSFNADLDFTLTSPAGTIVTISTDNGINEDNVFNGTVWDDQANPGGQVPYSNIFGLVTDSDFFDNVLSSPNVPEEAMSAFNGENPNGTWTFTIQDDTIVDGGMLNSWTLDIVTLTSTPTTFAASATNSTPTPISSGAASVVTSTLPVAGLSGTILDLNLTTFITHTRCDDLDVTIQSPAGTVVTLTTDNAANVIGLDDLFNGTVWDDDVNPGGGLPQTTNNGIATEHVYANGVLASPLVPEEAMGAFIGESANGNWTITISDDVVGNGGTLASWTLDFTMATCDCTLTCPSNVTQATDAGVCSAVVTYPPPTVFGQCNTITCAPPSGSTFPLGTTTVTCTEDVINPRDERGGPSCGFTVTVVDLTPPTIACPANITTGADAGQCGAVVGYTSPTPTDNCTGATTVCVPASGSFFPVGTTTVTCTTTDAAGNTASCSFSVSVNDTQPPALTCPANITTAGTSLDGCGVTATVAFAAPTASDNCPGVTTACVPASGTVFPEGTTTVTCTGTDGAGNTATCAFTVTVTVAAPTGVMSGACAVDDLTGDSWTIVTDPDSPLYRFWRYRVAATGEILCGMAHILSHSPRRSLVAADTDDPRFFMNANLNFRANTGTVTVQDILTGRRFVIRDRNLGNSVCP